MFDPSLGRWITEDPIDFEGGDINLYRAEANNPTNRIDPSGLKIAYGDSDITGAEAEKLFFQRLGVTKCQALVLDKLRKNLTFQQLWKGLLDAKQTVKLVITDERQLGSSTADELVINPNHGRHGQNPLELADTLIHEILHHLIRDREFGTGKAPIPKEVNDFGNDTFAQQKFGIEGRGGRTKAYFADKVANDGLDKGIFEYMEKTYGLTIGGKGYNDLNIAGQKLIKSILNDLLKDPQIQKCECKETATYKIIAGAWDRK